MINPGELQFGNFIIDDEGCLVRVCGFEPHSHSVRCDEPEGCKIIVDIYRIDGKIKKGYECESTGCNPIELTPEWLRLCGFIDPINNGMAYRMDINLSDELCWYMQDGFLRYQTIGSGFSRPIEHIKYIHQLQNFFYWYAGKELTIKTDSYVAI